MGPPTFRNEKLGQSYGGKKHQEQLERFEYLTEWES